MILHFNFFTIFIVLSFENESKITISFDIFFAFLMVFLIIFSELNVKIITTIFFFVHKNNKDYSPLYLKIT